MIISHKLKYVFIHVPKTGGTSIKQKFDPDHGHKHFFGFHSDIIKQTKGVIFIGIIRKI